MVESIHVPPAPGSDVDLDQQQIGETLVSLFNIVSTGLKLAAGTLSTVNELCKEGNGTTMEVLGVLLRSALIRAPHVAYVLLPDDRDERVHNWTQVLYADTDIGKRGWKACSTLKILPKAPEELHTQADAARLRLQALSK